MKNLSLEELKKLAKEQFELNPSMEEVYATADGNVFLQKAKSSADTYARQSGQRLHTITVDDVNTEESAEEIKPEEIAEGEKKTPEASKANTKKK